MRAPGVDTRYTYAVGRIRVLETRLLSESDFETLLEEEDLEALLKVLSEFGEYSKLAESFRNKENLEVLFSNELLDIYNLINKMMYEKEFMEPFFKKLELLMNPLDKESIELDAYIWNLFYAKWKENMFLKEYIEIAIDLENIKIFFRARLLQRDKGFLNDSLIEDGKTKRNTFLELFDRPQDEIFSKIGSSRYERVVSAGLDEYKNNNSISLLEKACDDFLIDYIKKAKYFHFGMESLIAYVLAKENEIKNLRIILVGMENGFKQDFIRSYLRRSYV